MDTPPKPLAHLYKQELTPEEQALWDAGERLREEQEARDRQEIAADFAPLPWVRTIDTGGGAPINPRNFSSNVLDRLPKSHPAYQPPAPNPIDPARLKGATNLMIGATRALQERNAAED